MWPSSSAGLLTPGSTLGASFMVDTVLNPFFTFGAMPVSSNDFFTSSALTNLIDNAIAAKARRRRQRGHASGVSMPFG